MRDVFNGQGMNKRQITVSISTAITQTSHGDSSMDATALATMRPSSIQTSIMQMAAGTRRIMYVCMYVRTYVCMYVCMYIRTYVRMYVMYVM